MEDSSDFPAAHSMDTTWFAIDRDGNVALMDSSEGGAVPELEGLDQATGWEQLNELMKRVAPVVAPVEGQHREVLCGTFVMLGDATAIKKFADKVEIRADGCVVAEFRLEQKAEKSFMAGIKLFGRKQDGDGRQPMQRAHDAGVCRGCVHDDSGDLDQEEAAKKLGLFHYAGPAGIAEPYERAYVPESPLAAERIAGLPGPVARFPGSFRDHAQLQPVEHWSKVASWSASYLGTDGKVRCVPGREKDYAKEYADLVQNYDDVDPPKKS